VANNSNQVVPSITGLSDIKDPAVRRVLQAMTTGLNVRNGLVGDGKERFLTKADMERSSSEIVARGMSQLFAGGSQFSGGGSRTPYSDYFSSLSNSLSEWLAANPLFQHLSRRIEFITADNSTALARLRDLETGFTETREFVESESASTANRLSATVTRTGEAEAALIEEITVRTTNDSAFVSAVNTMWAAVGVNNALIESGGSVSTNWNGAEANMWNQLQAEVFTSGGQTIRAALAQEATIRADETGDLFGQYTVKIDLNGYIAGFGLAATSPIEGGATSSFIVRADEFIVATPGQGTDVPFAVIGGNTQFFGNVTGSVNGIPAANVNQFNSLLRGVSTVSDTDIIATWNKLTAANGLTYINNAAITNALIANAAIGTANIIDANVSTLKIAGEAVTVPRFFTGSNQTVNWTSAVTVVSGSITLDAVGGLIATGGFYVQPVGFDAYGVIEIYIGGVYKAGQIFGVRTGGADTNYSLPITISAAANGLSGSVTVEIKVYRITNPGGSNVNFSITGCNLSVMGGKR